MAEPLARSLGRLGFEQRLAALGAVLLVVSTFGPFSFVEAAEVLTALAVLALLLARGRGREFHLPFGDGAVIVAAAGWAGLLIVVRMFDRPLGQNLLALGCAAILLFAGLREHVVNPPDDVRGPRAGDEPPDDLMRRPDPGEPRPDRAATAALPADRPDQAETEQMSLGDAPDTARTEPLPPPEYEPGSAPASSAGRRRGAAGGQPQKGEAGRGGGEPDQRGDDQRGDDQRSG